MAARPFRIIFMGTPEFAVPSLQTLLARHEQVVAVVSQPDRPKGRGRKLASPPVKELALAHHIPVLQPTKIRTPEFLEELRALEPDLIVVTAYGRILPKHLIELPPHGTINVHASILPRHRGAAPVQWAVLKGDAETGVTIMQMDEGLDTGDILHIERLPIEAGDTSGSLAHKVSALGGIALGRALDMLHAGTLVRTRQDDSLHTLAPPLAKEQGLVNWQLSAHELDCLVRGLDPWPSAYTFADGARLRLFASEVSPVDPADFGSPAPGTVCRADKAGLLVATGHGLLLVTELQPEGGRRLAAADFLRGRPLAPGTLCGS